MMEGKFITDYSCIACVMNQVSGALHAHSVEEGVAWKVVEELVSELNKGDIENRNSSLRKSPVFLCGLAFETMAKIVGANDYYHRQKIDWNNAALALYPRLKELVDKSKTPLQMAVKLAIIGNLIDFGVGEIIKEADEGTEHNREKMLWKIILQFLESSSFYLRSWNEFSQKAEEAQNILYIVDNAGEIVFDKLLIDELGALKVAVVVRNFPIINDATEEDAGEIGLQSLGCQILKDGSIKAMPAFTFEYCADDVVKLFREADIVICKGMGNFESLYGRGGEHVFFLLVTKCDVVCRRLNTQENSLILIQDKG